MDEMLLMVKETLREMRVGGWNRADAPMARQRMYKQFERVATGELSFEDYIQLKYGTLEELEKAAQQAESASAERCDLVEIVADDAANEAETKRLPLAALALAQDATKRCAAGISAEDWVYEVLSGHSGDSEAQLGCLKIIVRLWSDGPWPWADS